MNTQEIDQASKAVMGCGCTMFLIPFFGVLLIMGILMVLSMAGVIK